MLNIFLHHRLLFLREQGRDLNQSYNKNPYTITQRLRTDFGRSVGVTTATPIAMNVFNIKAPYFIFQRKMERGSHLMSVGSKGQR